ncbi:hypothetical protein J0H58_05485 [bacterium]|nr:hypothetical protein [bacterium]
MPSFGLAHPRARFRFDRLTAAALARIARFPSYRAPRAADLHDPTTFQPPTEPYDSDDLTGRAFITNGTTRPTVRLVAVQPYMTELAACPHLATLRRLDLTGNRIGPDGMRALAASPCLGGLREVVLNGNAVGADGAAALAAAPWTAGLTRLEIADNGLSAGDVARVLGVVPRLEAVDVSGNTLDADVVVLLRFRDVTARSVGARGVSDGAANPVAHAPGSVQSLDLRHNHVDLLDLLAHGPFPALTQLDLGFNDLGDARLTAADLPALRSLGLRANRLVSPALAHPGVEDLDISVNPLADHATIVAGFPNLVRLDLGNTTLTDAGLRRLLCVLPPALRSLNLAWNPIGDAAAVALAETSNLPALASLDLKGTRVTRRGLLALASRFGTIPA